MAAVNVTDLANGLEAVFSRKYTASVTYLQAGGFNAGADTVKTFIVGSTTLAVNFATLMVSFVGLIQRVGELAADTSRTASIARTLAGYAVCATEVHLRGGSG